VQSDVHSVAEHMRETFQDAARHQLQEIQDVSDFDLSEPSQLLRRRHRNVAHADADMNMSEIPGRWLPFNPTGLPTEREVHTADKGKPVYRFMLQKQKSPAAG
jgi:hypothetical protein